MVNFEINKDMLPMKGHFFLFNAGTAPLVPYLPTFAKQLGFSTYIVGIIYTFLPIFGLLAKPIFGALGDRFDKHKSIFIIFQIITIGAFVSLYFVPDIPSDSTVSLSCGDGETFFHVCSNSNDTLDDCRVSDIISGKETAKCDMTCSMQSHKMWQTVCEHWRVPDYCYGNEMNLTFTSIIQKKKINVDKKCAYLPIEKTRMIDNKEFTPVCERLREVSLPCSLQCSDSRLNEFLTVSGDNIDMVCTNNGTSYTSCKYDETYLKNFITNFTNDTSYIECTSNCRVKKPWEIADMCEGWKADESVQCYPNVSHSLKSIFFTGSVDIAKTQILRNCAYFKLGMIVMPDGTAHYPTCPPYQTKNESERHFHTDCQIKCDNQKLNIVFETVGTKTEKDNYVSYYQFWLFFLFMILNWVGMAVVVSIADAICFEKLGDNAEDYGKQRLWGSVGWGIFSLLTGYLIDKMSKDDEIKDYTVAFILMLIMLSLDVVVSTRLQYKQKNMSVNIFKNVGILFKSWQTCQFFVWIILVGLCTGLLWQFLFWFLEDLAKVEGCNEIASIKTLQGLISGIQCFGGEIPFFFISGAILKRIGHHHAMTLVLLGFGLRYVLYSFLTNPWWALPIELFQGLTFGMLYTTMTSYASLISTPGIEATVMGLVGAVFEGIGTSLGSFIGGIMYAEYGGSITFRIFGCIALIGAVINVILTYVKKTNRNPNEAEYLSIIRFNGQNDNFEILDNGRTELQEENGTSPR